jgi:hypothetical protein
MRDSVGNAIHMELFQSRFEGDDSRVRYLVGIREFRIGIETMVKQLIYISVAMVLGKPRRP